MKSPSVIYRVTLAAVVEAILLLIVVVGDAFADMSAVREFMFHNLLYHVAVFVICWFAAPITVKVIGGPK